MTAPIRSMPELTEFKFNNEQKYEITVGQSPRASAVGMSGYEVGDIISWHVRRSWLEIWWDRIVSRHWDVPTTKEQRFECVSTSAGAIWPEVK